MWCFITQAVALGIQCYDAFAACMDGKKHNRAALQAALRLRNIPQACVGLSAVLTRALLEMAFQAIGII